MFIFLGTVFWNPRLNRGSIYAWNSPRHRFWLFCWWGKNSVINSWSWSGTNLGSERYINKFWRLRCSRICFKLSYSPLVQSPLSFTFEQSQQNPHHTNVVWSGAVSGQNYNIQKFKHLVHTSTGVWRTSTGFRPKCIALTAWICFFENVGAGQCVWPLEENIKPKKTTLDSELGGGDLVPGKNQCFNFRSESMNQPRIKIKKWFGHTRHVVASGRRLAQLIKYAFVHFVL